MINPTKLMMIAILLLLTFALSTAQNSNCRSSGIYTNLNIPSDSAIYSPDGNVRFNVQKDGNLCLYTHDRRWNSWVQRFCTGTVSVGGDAYYLSIQYDGNMVLYDGSHTQQWSKGTGISPISLCVDDCGYAYLTDTVDNKLWFSKYNGNIGVGNYPLCEYPYPYCLTNGIGKNLNIPSDSAIYSPDGNVRFNVQTDGNLCLYTYDREWSSWVQRFCTGTVSVGGDAYYLSIQFDGNMVLYDGSHTQQWSTGTSGTSPTTLCVNDCGYAYLTDTYDNKLWYSQYNGNIGVGNYPLSSCSVNLPCQNAYLSDLAVKDQTAGWGGEGAGINEWMGYNTMLMGNHKTYTKFLVIHPTYGTYANAFRSFALNGQYKRFTAVVGSAGTTNECKGGYANYGSFSIKILVDGVQKYYRNGFGQTGYDIVDIDVHGANEIKIETDNGGDWACDHPAIADPLLSCRPEWTAGLTLGYGDNKYNGELIDIGAGAFNKLFQTSRYFIVKRECSSCSNNYKEIYYKRLTAPQSFDVYGYMQSWRSENNIINQHFALYPTLKDAIYDTKRWTYCNYDDFDVGAFRDCGISFEQRETCQWTSSFIHVNRNWNGCNRPSKFLVYTSENVYHGATEPNVYDGFRYGTFSLQIGKYLAAIIVVLLIVNAICLGINCFSNNKNDSEVTDF